MNYREMKAYELEQNKRPFDDEACAILFSAAKDEFANLLDFGIACANTNGEDGCLLIEPWEEKDYEAHEIPESVFWQECLIQDYLTTKTALKKGNCKNVICFWEEWNNSFFVIEVENEYIGVEWWTTA